MSEYVFNKPRLRAKIYSIPIVGDIAYDLVCIFMRLSVSSVMRLSGYVMIKCGSSRVWSPKEWIQRIQGGIEFLRVHDEQMYTRLRSESLIFYYSSNAWQSAHNLFPLNDVFIKWEAEGVATFFVQSILMHAASKADNPYRVNREDQGMSRE